MSSRDNSQSSMWALALTFSLASVVWQTVSYRIIHIDETLSHLESWLNNLLGLRFIALWLHHEMAVIVHPFGKDTFLIKLKLNRQVSTNALPPSQGSFWLTSIFHPGCMFRCSAAETVDSVLWKHQAEHREPVWSTAAAREQRASC